MSSVPAPDRPQQQPAVGNLGDVAALLRSFGVATSATHASVEDVVGEELRERGLQARVVSLRYGALSLEADAVTAKLLSFERDNLLEAINARVSDAVSSLQVRVARR